MDNIHKYLKFKKLYYEIGTEKSLVRKELEERFDFLIEEYIPIKSLKDIQIPINENPYKVKNDYIVLTTHKNPNIIENGRSADYTLHSFSTSCVGKCTYCYQWRHKLKDNPLIHYTNIESIINVIDKHSKDAKKISEQTDSKYITYDIGCSSDVSIDYELSNNIRRVFDYFVANEKLKAVFATKFVNRSLLKYNPKNKIRIRFSLMPESYSKMVEIGTDSVIDRIFAINEFVEAGYEVHINFSPVIITWTWKKEYAELFYTIDALLSVEAKQQLKCEVIFLTHNENLHKLNLSLKNNEELLYEPSWQENKVSSNGDTNIRYKVPYKRKAAESFKNLLKTVMPYCEIRYIF
jgi:DNA repair photolyase